MRMPRFHAPCAGLTEPDSESAEYSMSFLSMKIPLGRLNCGQSAMNLPVLIEDLDAVVPAVADEQTALRIEREARAAD